MNNLIIIKQLPIIEEKLKEMNREISEKIEKALALSNDENSMKEIRDIRADLNKDFKELEDKRKEVKSKVLEPYEQFEEAFKKYISIPFKTADKELKEKVESMENEIKERKEQTLREYFEEYAQSLEIDFVNYKQAGITINLSISDKKMKEQAKAFLDKIDDDLKVIKTQENKDEIYFEYVKNLNLAKSIEIVNQRLKALEEMKKAEEERKKQEEIVNQRLKEEKEKFEKAIEPFMPPKVEEKEQMEEVKVGTVEDKKFVLKFTVKATLPKLKELKKFLEDGGYDYE